MSNTPPSLSVASLKSFYRAPATVAAVAALRAAQKLAAERRAHVNSYLLPLLLDAGLRKPDGVQVTDLGRLYLCKDEEACARFFAACDAAHAANGYAGLGAGYCPALMAENEVTKAERALLAVAAKGLFAGADLLHGKSREKLLALLLNPPQK